MERSELTELHYITPIANVPSILQHGRLSHTRAEAIQHKSVAMSEIQDLRATVVVPGSKRLHDFANLYICARNPMMYKLQTRYKELCILRINHEVIHLPGVVITDCNASSSYVRFSAAPDGIAIVNSELFFR
ncbi:MAG: DUF4433 domain-containing protein [Spirochaetota bacterium]